jgi:hypothetical protein
MALVLSRQPFTAEARVLAGVRIVEFLLDKVARDKFFSEFIGLLLSISFSHGCLCSYIIGG